MANATGGFCPMCGARMIPLFQSFACERQCDLPPDKRSKKADYIDIDWGWDDIKTPTLGPPCDGCKSRKTEPYTHPLFNWHCIDCGRVWMHYVNP